MRRLAVLLLALLPAIAFGGGDYEDDEDQDQDQSTKEVGGFNGHSLFDLGSLGLFAALKIKFVVVLLVALAVFLLLTKSYKTQCLFGNCRPNYSTYGYYPYVDYTYMGYELPGSAAYRRPGVPADLTVVQGVPGLVPGVVAKDSHHLSDLTARVWNSIDLASMAFGALNIQEEDCRRKLVCQADRAAAKSLLLRTAMSWFNSSLARYRTDRSRFGPVAEQQAGDRGGDAGVPSMPWRQEDPCEEMYPLCLHRDLPAALGGPSRPPVFLDHHQALHHHHHHRHHQHHQHLDHAPGHVVDLPGEQWQPIGYQPEYQLNQYPFYASYREPVREPLVEEVEPLRPSDLQVQTTASATLSHLSDNSALGLGADLVLASASATPAAVQVQAVGHDGAAATTSSTAAPAPGLEGALSTASSLASSLSPESPAEPRAPGRPAIVQDVNANGATKLTSTSTSTTTQAAGATASHVWRRMHFGSPAAPAPSSNQSKLHAD